MFKRIASIVFVAFVLAFDVFSQNTISNQQLLQSVQQQFKAKQYDEVIETANKALFDKDATKDSCLFMMYDFKAVSYYYKHQEDSAVSILVKGIELCEELGKKDEALVELYRSYLDIACPSYREGFSYEAVPYKYRSREYDVDRYKEYSINLLKYGNRIYSKDFERYGRGFLDRIWHSKWHNPQNNEISDAIDKEKNLVKDIAVRPFDTYFKYLQTEVTGEASQYLKVAKEFEFFLGNNRDELIEKWIDNCYNKIAYYYYSEGHIEAVAEYFKNYVSFLKSKNPDYIINKKEGNSLNENALRHIAYLQRAMRFEDVKDYCHEIMNNPSFEIISIDTSDYISKILDWKDIVLTIEKNPRKRIDPIYYRYDDELYYNINNDGVDYCFPYIYKQPIFRINDEKLSKIWDVDDNNKQIDALIDYLQKDIIKVYQEWFGFDETNSIKQESSSFEDFLVSMGKLQWEGDVMGFETWISCAKLAYLYYREKDYNNSVKWQQMAVDIVELDTDTSRWDSYEHFLSGYNIDYNNIGITYINVEFFNYREMAFYYKKAKQFDKSLEYYSKAADLYMQVLQIVFKGSDMEKEQVWENHKTILSDIIYEIIGDCNEYPPFGDLVLELSALQKVFLAWQKIALKDAVDESNNKTIMSLYDRKLNSEKDIELSYYKILEQKGRAKLFGELADYEVKLKSQIGSKNILDRTIVKTEDIKQSLSTNDVYVDFVEIPTSSIIDVRYLDGHISQIEKKVLVAILLKKQWDYPKVVVIGNNFDDEVANLVTIKQNGFSDTEINDIYLDTIFAHYIWDKIASKAGLNKNDNVYFVPDGYLHKVAIESLSFDGEKLVSDVYNCYRMSSARELLRKKSKISRTDKCLGIGGLQYSKSLPLAIDGQQKKKNSKKNPFFAFNYYRKRNTAPSSMFNRDVLEPLTGSQAELEYLTESFGDSVTIIKGAIGTESYVLQNINKIKPSVLHIGTHGFNCINKDLSTEEELFLMGNRDSYISPMENSLYRTGLYMSLPRYESSKTASDGIITAKEISMTDLSNTKLVVLSACSTALGNVNSEGVYGLQRGLKLAGAESILVSLWDVNDKSTELLIKEFYKQLSMGKTRREALQEAQEAVRNYDEDLDDCDIGEYKTFEAPCYWAGFVLIDGNE